LLGIIVIITKDEKIGNRQLVRSGIETKPKLGTYYRIRSL